MVNSRHILITFVSIVTLAASLTFTLFFAVALVIGSSIESWLAITAALFDLIDLTYLTSALFRVTGASTHQRRKAVSCRLFACWSVAIFGAHAFTIALLAWLQIQNQIPSTMFRGSWYGFIYVSWALIAISALSHAIQVTFDWPRGSSAGSEEEPYQALALLPADSKMHGRPTVQSITEPSGPCQQSHSPISHEGFDLTTSAMPQSLASASSRTRLVGATSPVKQSTSISTHVASNKAVDRPSPASNTDANDYAPRPSTPVYHQRLEPIPGSTSNSPGHALGPAPDSIPDGISRSRVVFARTSSDSAVDESRIAPRFRKHSMNARPNSPIINESHIHPLFRLDNPLPPPTPTIATTVTASAEDLHRARLRTRPSSPNHAGAPGRSHQNILNGGSTRTSLDQGSPIGPHA